jgi:hypothetical protein
MWKIDPEGGNSFSSHREAKEESRQASLFEAAAQTNRLSQLLLEKFSRARDVPVSEIFRWVTEETEVFLPRHARKELESLLEKRKISYADPENSGKKRRPGAWPDRILVTFLE